MNHSCSNCAQLTPKSQNIFANNALIDFVVMEWRTKSKQILSKLILEEDEGAMKPTIR